MYVWGVSDEGPENGCGPDLKHQRRLEKEPDGRGAAKQGGGGGDVRPYKGLVSAFPWQFPTSSGRENCKRKRVPSVRGGRTQGAQTLVPGRILFHTVVLSDYKDPAAGVPLSNKFPGSEPNLKKKK